jgi:hypothetical protein
MLTLQAAAAVQTRYETSTACLVVHAQRRPRTPRQAGKQTDTRDCGLQQSTAPCASTQQGLSEAPAHLSM